MAGSSVMGQCILKNPIASPGFLDRENENETLFIFLIIPEPTSRTPPAPIKKVDSDASYSSFRWSSPGQAPARFQNVPPMLVLHLEDAACSRCASSLFLVVSETTFIVCYRMKTGISFIFSAPPLRTQSGLVGLAVHPARRRDQMSLSSLMMLQAATSLPEKNRLWRWAPAS
jgi:hypothetical protein